MDERKSIDRSGAGLFRRLADRVFGYDFFLSYAHADGLFYPLVLKKKLEASGFAVFLDQSGFFAGDDLTPATIRRVRMSCKLVVVARPAALRSKWVRREVEAHLGAGKTPIVIDVNRAVETAAEDADLGVMIRGRDWLRVQEGVEESDGAPSDQCLQQLVRSFDATRQETRRLRFFRSAAGLFAGLALLAVTGGVIAVQQRNRAERGEAEANSRLAQLMAERGSRDIRDDYPWGAWVWFAEALKLDARLGRPEWQNRARIAAVRGLLPQLARVVSGEGGIDFAAFSDDAQLLLTYHPGKLESAGWLKLRDLTRARESVDLETGRYRLVQVGWTPGEEHVFALGVERGRELPWRLMRWHAPSGELVSDRPVPQKGRVILSSRGDYALVLADAEEARIFHTEDWSLVRSIPLGEGDGEAEGLFSPAGDRVALRVGTLVSIHPTHADHDQPPVRLPHDETVRRVVLGPENRHALTAGGSSVFLWSLREGRLLGRIDVKGKLVDFGLSPEGDRFFLCREHQDARSTEIWSASEPPRLSVTIDHEEVMAAWEFVPRQTGGAASVTFFGMKASNPFRREAGFSPDGEHIFTVSEKRSMARVWRIRDATAITPPLSHFGRGVWFATFSPDGRFFSTVDSGGQLRIWDLAARRLPRRLTPVPARIDRLVFSSDGRFLAATFYERGQAIWDLEAGDDARTELQTYDNDSSALVFDQEKGLVAAGGFGKTVRIWDTSAGRLRTRPIAHPGHIDFLDIDRSAGRLLVAGGGYKEPGRLRVWDLETGEPVTPVLEHERTLADAVLSSDGSRALVVVGASYEEEGFAILWNLATRMRVGELRHREPVRAALFLGSEKQILTVSPSEFRRWDATSGSPLGLPTENLSLLKQAVLAVSTDGSHALLAGRDQKTAQVVATATGRPASLQLDHETRISSAGFSQDGRRLYTATENKLFLWDAATGNLLAPPFVHEGWVHSAVFDPAGRRIAVSTGDSQRYGTYHDCRLVLWSLEEDNTDPEALALLAQLNSEHRIDRVGAFVQQQPDAFERDLIALSPFPRLDQQGRDWRYRSLRSAETGSARDHHIKELLTKYPLFGPGHFERAEVLRREHRDQEAVESYRRAIELGVDNWRIHNRLGLSLSALSRWKEAADAFARALSFRKDDSEIWYHRAMALLHLDDPEAQEEHCNDMYRDFFSNEPKAEHWNPLAFSCAFFRGPISCRKDLLRFYEEHAAGEASRSDQVAYSLLLFREGEDEKALRLAEAQPSMLEAMLLRAAILRKRGQKEEADRLVTEVRQNLERLESERFGRLTWAEKSRFAALLADAG